MFDSKEHFTEAHTRFLRGDSIEDDELQSFLNYYVRLNAQLDAIKEPAFKLFQNELRSRLTLLKGYDAARKEMKLNEVFRVQRKSTEASQIERERISRGQTYVEREATENRAKKNAVPFLA